MHSVPNFRSFVLNKPAVCFKRKNNKISPVSTMVSNTERRIHIVQVWIQESHYAENYKGMPVE